MKVAESISNILAKKERKARMQVRRKVKKLNDKVILDYQYNVPINFERDNQNGLLGVNIYGELGMFTHSESLARNEIPPKSRTSNFSEAELNLTINSYLRPENPIPEAGPNLFQESPSVHTSFEQAPALCFELPKEDREGSHKSPDQLQVSYSDFCRNKIEDPKPTENIQIKEVEKPEIPEKHATTMMKEVYGPLKSEKILVKIKSAAFPEGNFHDGLRTVVVESRRQESRTHVERLITIRDSQPRSRLPSSMKKLPRTAPQTTAELKKRTYDGCFSKYGFIGADYVTLPVIPSGYQPPKPDLPFKASTAGAPTLPKLFSYGSQIEESNQELSQEFLGELRGPNPNSTASRPTRRESQIVNPWSRNLERELQNKEKERMRLDGAYNRIGILIQDKRSV
jgi:hypothetical protein